jgi:hypothetical protein
MRLALLSVIATFAGSIAGFHLTAATGAPGADIGASPPTGSEVVHLDANCPERRAVSGRAGRRA